ncbi:putative membrane protein [Palleronia aestuarii]|uniref:Protoporphyrinogen IX oxidase n=1 Tax=Palleronia aestuarii TaxID=568105 RepID=A0A2W7NHP3_9RHOB|nr:protoporphyrinogen oxidase HemJ [Palleronia aestuarii]PZX18973.1 putative membrane protein [Palleronia aestuarii]
MAWLYPYYPWIKALHVIAVVAWMAGLFYLPRLFVYHVEAASGEADREALFRTMETRLLKAIMNPAMIATWVFGLTMVLLPGLIDWSAIWPWTKAAAVLAMTGFHMWCAAQRRHLAENPAYRSGRYYRAMNEVPTLLLVVIVISVIVRPF